MNAPSIMVRPVRHSCVLKIFVLFCFFIIASPASVLHSIYKWNPQTKDYTIVSDDEHLSAGTILWIKGSTATTLQVTGTYSDPTNTQITEAGYYPVMGLQMLNTTSALPVQAQLARLDVPSQRWQIGTIDELGFRSELPDFLALGEAIFINASTPVELEAPDPALDVRYYHEEHLGSTSAMTDADGNMIEHAAFYPFGALRHHATLLPTPENYQFTQKEQDQESALHYFESRYLASHLSRFARADPLPEDRKSDWPQNPQRYNTYAYAHNNPVILTDPTGMEAAVFISDNNEVTITIAIKYRGEQATPENIEKVNRAIEETWSGQFGGYNVKTVVVESDPSLKSSDIELKSAEGSAVVRGKDKGQWDPDEPEVGAWVAAHETGHLLGLEDRKSRVVINGKLVRVPHRGWEGNVMASAFGRPDERSIRAIIRGGEIPSKTSVFRFYNSPKPNIVFSDDLITSGRRKDYDPQHFYQDYRARGGRSPGP
jgi:RHS repeat-associated protein